MPFQILRKWLGVEIVEVSVLERTVSGLGAAAAMLVLLGVSSWVVPGMGALAVLASMGASAVLLFAVPHGQLSQPWPVIAGHVLSALIGVTCARHVPDGALAAACAVGLAVAAMHQLKCIHPPGGATAFTAVLGGEAVRDLGYSFVLVPVLLNAVAMVLLAVLINYLFRWRRYPAALSPSASPVRPTDHQRVLEAVRSLDSFVDVSEEELIRLTEILARERR